MTEPVVAVLLSTFNGAAFLREQLESLRHQVGVTVLLHARDDGSCDETCAILREYARLWPDLRDMTSGTNLGATGSFLELLKTAPPQAEYFAFCDQDDVWQPQKLTRAVAAIAGDAGPALYCSNVNLVGGDLTPIGVPPANGDTSFGHVLFENVAFGCTTVMNRAAHESIASHPPLDDVVMHDWWCALVVAAMGRIRYDPEPALLYRQHARNAVGLRGNWLVQSGRDAGRLLRKARHFYRAHPQAAALERLYGAKMPPESRAILQHFVASKRSLGARLAYALTGPVKRRRVVDSALIRGLIAAGWY